MDIRNCDFLGSFLEIVLRNDVSVSLKIVVVDNVVICNRVLFVFEMLEM